LGGLPAAATAMPLPQSAVKAKPPPVNEESASAAVGELAWVQNSRLHPHLYNAYAQAGGGARFRVNAPGTQAGLGSGIDGHTLAYTQVHGGQESIRLFNLQTQLHFQNDDTWALDHFSANFAGAKISLTGQVAHAPEILKWKTFAGGNATVN